MSDADGAVERDDGPQSEPAPDRSVGYDTTEGPVMPGSVAQTENGQWNVMQPPTVCWRHTGSGQHLVHRLAVTDNASMGHFRDEWVPATVLAGLEAIERMLVVDV